MRGGAGIGIPIHTFGVYPRIEHIWDNEDRLSHSAISDRPIKGWNKILVHIRHARVPRERQHHRVHALRRIQVTSRKPHQRADTPPGTIGNIQLQRTVAPAGAALLKGRPQRRISVRILLFTAELDRGRIRRVTGEKPVRAR